MKCLKLILVAFLELFKLLRLAIIEELLKRLFTDISLILFFCIANEASGRSEDLLYFVQNFGVLECFRKSMELYVSLL
jgi:hypothetical protein